MLSSCSEDQMLSDDIYDRSASFCESVCVHFKKSDFPLAFAHGFHDSRKSIIENRMLVGIGGHNGRNWSAISTQDV